MQNQERQTYKQLLFALGNMKKREHSPKVDLLKRGDEYVIRMELPGIDEKDIKIVLKDDRFFLISVNKHKNVQEGDNVIYTECKYGVVTRRVKLPTEISDYEFEFYNGVLLVKCKSVVVQPEPESEVVFGEYNANESWADAV